MAEASMLGLVQIILHIVCAIFCLGLLVASAVTFEAIDDFVSNVDNTEDMDQYRGAAGWLLFVAIAGIIIQAVMVIACALYYGEVIASQLVGVVFRIVFIIWSILLALCLISGGIPSAVNAADVQDDYLDYYIICDQDDLPDSIEKPCNDLRKMRDSQAASAGLAFIGAGLCGVITVLVILSFRSRRNVS